MRAVRTQIIVLAALLVAISGHASEGQEPQAESTHTSQEASTDQRGTENAPVVVKVLPTPVNYEEANQHQGHRNDESYDRRLAVVLTGVLVLVAMLQTGVYALQARRLRQTIEASDANAARQLRAYISLGTGVYGPQDLNRQAHMELRPVLKNTGQTPAYAVSTAFCARVLPFPLPEDFDFSLPIEQREAAGVIGPGERHFVLAVLDRTLSPAELHEIGGPGQQKLYVYGRVTYRDAFGKSHYTNFCQFSLWDQTGNHFGINTNRHNDAD